MACKYKAFRYNYSIVAFDIQINNQYYISVNLFEVGYVVTISSSLLIYAESTNENYRISEGNRIKSQDIIPSTVEWLSNRYHCDSLMHEINHCVHYTPDAGYN